MITSGYTRGNGTRDACPTKQPCGVCGAAVPAAVPISGIPNSEFRIFRLNTCGRFPVLIERARTKRIAFTGRAVSDNVGHSYAGCDFTSRAQPLSDGALTGSVFSENRDDRVGKPLRKRLAGRVPHGSPPLGFRPHKQAIRACHGKAKGVAGWGRRVSGGHVPRRQAISPWNRPTVPHRRHHIIGQ